MSTNRFLKIIVWPIIFAPAIYLASIWSSIPQQVAMHFNLQGEADRFGDKQEMLGPLLLLTGVNALVYLLLTNLYRIDPKRYAIANKSRLQRMAFTISIFISAVDCIIIYSSSRGSIQFHIGWILAATGLLFAVIGNYMPNLKPNYFAGFRIPWALEDPDNWRKTHALAGKLWFFGGILVAILCLIFPPILSMIIFFCVMSVITVIPVVYSYRLFKQNKLNS